MLKKEIVGKGRSVGRRGKGVRKGGQGKRGRGEAGVGYWASSE